MCEILAASMARNEHPPAHESLLDNWGLYPHMLPQDWVDGPCRAAALELLQSLITLDPSEELELARQLPSSCLLVGCGGRGAWEEAVVSFAACFIPTPQGLAQQILGDVEGLAARWVLAAGVGDAASVARQRQCLAYIRALVQQLAGAKGVPAAAAPAWVVRLLQEGVRSPDEGVRAEALRCLGLLALLPGAQQEGQKEALHAAACAARQLLGNQHGGDVQQAAAQVLLDLLLVYGQREVEEAVIGWASDEAGLPGVSDVADQLGRAHLGGGGSTGAAAAHAPFSTGAGDGAVGEEAGRSQGAQPPHHAPLLHSSVVRSLQDALWQLLSRHVHAVAAVGKKRSKASQQASQPVSVTGTAEGAALAVTLAQGLARLVLYQVNHI